MYQVWRSHSESLACRQTYNDIINVLPQVVTLTQGHLNPGINPPLPKKEDHPLIKNWTKSEHDKSVARDRATSTSNSAPQRGKQKASDDPSDKTDFLENEFGEPVFNKYWGGCT